MIKDESYNGNLRVDSRRIKRSDEFIQILFWRKSVISIHYNYGVEKLDVRFEKSIAILVIVFLARSLKNIQLIYLQNWEKGYNVGITSIFNADVEDLIYLGSEIAEILNQKS